MTDETTRRGFLGSLATGAGIALAGCATAPASDSNEPRGNVTKLDPLATPDDRGNPSRFTEVYRAVRDSVAEVRVRTGASVGRGTGWIYDTEGRLVTNEHVTRGATEVFVRFRTGDWRPARVHAEDVYSDLAVLVPEDLPESSSALPLRKQDPPIGEEVLAIGNPFGFSGSVSSGIVSGLDRSLPAAGGSQFSIPDAIQTDAPVNPGNSGGPLVDLQGSVVGVINSGGGDNIGFAISGALVSRVVPALIENGEYSHSYVGITLGPVTPEIAERVGLEQASGVYVAEAIEGEPADGVLESGDVIKRMGGQPIPTEQALSTFLALQTSPGDTIEIEVIRDGRRETVSLTLGERPAPQLPN
ncbi:S1C family serine protease [Halapricum hydrolyticum]|uniref:Trypsin-like peptidase domain-containing protein n=1 Tax=Halapricum hydrolyticum TaxID=2979991 RepID=A0AAE3IAK7_9EURY|nr:trypsin-like peptidase domain-containing protein [Halapricum hydrolyticum]MCU4717232.1 trypsin-like peptidase domain-containing protein [Halapricum hydrolyticum]MCU4726159.1 trypsin-like peptidase domain-containing protein [Halapricum hydrolyticum]